MQVAEEWAMAAPAEHECAWSLVRVLLEAGSIDNAFAPRVRLRLALAIMASVGAELSEEYSADFAEPAQKIMVATP